MITFKSNLLNLTMLDGRYRLSNKFQYRLEFRGGHVTKYLNYWNIMNALTEQMGPGTPIETVECLGYRASKTQPTDWAHGQVSKEPVIYLKQSALTMLILAKEQYENLLTE